MARDDQRPGGTRGGRIFGNFAEEQRYVELAAQHRPDRSVVRGRRKLPLLRTCQLADRAERGIWKFHADPTIGSKPSQYLWGFLDSSGRGVASNSVSNEDTSNTEAPGA